MGWSATPEQAKKTLWQVHGVLVQTRSRACRGDPGVHAGFGQLADALEVLMARGDAAFVDHLRSAQLWVDDVPHTREGASTPEEAVAFVEALTAVLRDLPATTDTARAADELEHLPCELVRLGGPRWLLDQDHPDHDPMLRALVQGFAARLAARAPSPPPPLSR
jgi:hypothetical protein